MGDSDRMPKIDVAKLRPAEIDFIRYVEKQNKERVEKLKKVRRNNLLTAGIIGCGVLGIYFYSMYAVKQETFLDDFEEPRKVIEKQ
ncbi:cytochrome c oxidase assembly factor 3, mitochondrial [Onthophagus taurus]|uniref:cytochrome c oxidase assembly factor 3, mitochondrial n=1 Tax=Onthophagus taurus TaxID=166361 RepID=UPI000C20CD70|nr:cytochrome c oxidase assembly factor 3, mitochondrial [Onthophagus taurus]